MKYCVLILGLLLLGCGGNRKQPVAEGPLCVLLEPQQYPAFEDNYPADDMLRAIDNNLRWLASGGQDKQWQFGQTKVGSDRMIRSLERFRELFSQHQGQPQTLRAALQAEFHCYQLTWSGSPDILFTGYYAPLFDGSRIPSETYRYPLYAHPRDTVKIRPSLFNPSMLTPGPGLRDDRVIARVENGQIVPYYDRREIDEDGALAGKNLELVYLADYFQVFTFQVQGGGFVRLKEGGYLRLNYAGKNGQAYRSIGRLLVDEGKIPEEEISMQAIGAYFEKYPDEVKRVCYQNPSYVFYQTDGKAHASIKPEHFPHGSLGFPVTTRRSIATDKRHFPGGALVFLEGSQRNLDGSGNAFSAFALDQDTGGAIRGNHIDFFQGLGPEAEHRAGLLKDEQGAVYFLLIREQADI